MKRLSQLDKFERDNYRKGIREALRAFKKRKTDERYYGPLFPTERTYFPLLDSEDDFTLRTPKSIVKALDERGYDVEDYVKGLATCKNNKDRKMKIGKLLKDKPKLLKRFNERMKGKKKNKKDLELVFTYNPKDVACMSTLRGWTSCMSLIYGCECSGVYSKIERGGMVVYLIKSKDKDIQDPICRYAIRRLKDPLTNAFVLVSEIQYYGAYVGGFKNRINEILHENNQLMFEDRQAMCFKDNEIGYSDSFYVDSIYYIKGHKRTLNNLVKILGRVCNEDSFETLDEYLYRLRFINSKSIRNQIQKLPLAYIRSVLVVLFNSYRRYTKNPAFFRKYNRQYVDEYHNILKEFLTFLNTIYPLNDYQYPFYKTFKYMGKNDTEMIRHIRSLGYKAMSYIPDCDLQKTNRATKTKRLQRWHRLQSQGIIDNLIECDGHLEPLNS